MATRSDRPAPCRLLEWDTAFWGFPVGRVEGDSLVPERVEEVDAWAGRVRIACLYFLARLDDPTTIVAAERSGFHLTDVRLTYGGRSEGSAGPSDGSVSVRDAIPDDVGALQGIAGESYEASRFYFDEAFPRPECRAMYETWIRRSCEGMADKVLAAAPGGRPLGYVTCHLPGEDGPAGTIGLVGVDPEARGLGLGQALVVGALDWFAARDVGEVTVVTQGRNLAAQRLYQRCGLVTRGVHLWYHKWYRSPGRDDPPGAGDP